MAKSKKKYIVFPNTDITIVATGPFSSGYSLSVFDTLEAAEDYARSHTSTGYSTTIAVTTSLLKPKPVEMITVDLAEEC